MTTNVEHAGHAGHAAPAAARATLSATRLSTLKRFAIAGALLGGLAFIGYRLLAGDAKPSVGYETTAVDRGEVIAEVGASGTLSALVTVQVGSQVSGRIQALYADFNTEVKKGQLIAKLDPQLFEAALEQARSNSLAAKAEAQKARVEVTEATRQLERTKTLADRNLIAAAELDAARAKAGVARANRISADSRVAQANASLRQAELNLTYTEIRSPIDGVVISRSVDVGQTVAASLQAPTLFVIAEDLRKMQVDTSVAEADVGKLRAGMPVSFTVDAFPSKQFQGRVRQIRNAPQTVDNVVTYDAVVDVDNAELELRPGMTANVTFVHAERDGVLRVPNAALRFRPTGEAVAQKSSRRAEPGHKTVWVLKNGVLTGVDVRAGITDGTRTEILAGELREGDRVVTEARGSAAAERPAGAPARSRGPRMPF